MHLEYIIMCQKCKKAIEIITVLVLVLLSIRTSYASSVIPPRDFGVLVQTSGMVVVAKAGESQSFGRGNLIMTSTRFLVVDVVKGSIAIGQSFNMESYGGQTEDFGLAIGGSPSFTKGETYLLSLSEHNGSWMSRHMSYGLLVQRRMLTGERIFTHLEESHDLNLVIPDGKSVELISNYKSESLISHLKSVATGKAIWNKSMADEVQEYDAHQSQSMLLPGNIMKLAAPPSGCDYMSYEGVKIRWKRFEDGQPVTVKVPSSATSQLINAANVAVNGWKAVPDINISTLQTIGATAISPTCGTSGLAFTGFLTGDARIFPDDPCNEVPDLSSCSGILAVAGPGFNPSATHTANSETWITASIGFMIVNNGTPACLSPTQYDQVITHELGHIIGFGHHTGAAANMNATCCNPITNLDRTCAVYIYGNGTVSENPLPTITSITPNSIKAGTSNQSVVISGSGYQSNSELFINPDLLGLGITIPSFNSTTINMNVTAPLDVTLGVRKFFVRNPTPGGGDSQQVNFFVTDTPTISSLSPSSGNAGSTVNLTINGTKFATGLSSLVVDSDLTVSNFTVVSPTQITASLTIPSSASSGSRNIRVFNLGTGGGNSNAQSFNIVGTVSTPTLTSVNPNNGNLGEQVSVTLTGTNFISGATVSAGTGITVGNVTVVSPTSITATFTIGSATSPGTRNVTVTTSAGTSGSQTFTVNASTVPPTVTTTAVTSVGTTTASTGGNVTDAGSSSVTARGVCFATTQSPTTANTCTSNGTGTGAFTSNLTGLNASTTYYVRAYATSSAGTSYGAQVSFTTNAEGVPPTVSTDEITSVTSTSANVVASVSSQGSSPVTTRGVCYATTQNPTTSSTCVSSGSGTGGYIANLTGLSPSTLYYVRAYATNVAGTSYGNQLNFTTTAAATAPTVSTTTPSAITATSATTGGNVTSEGTSPVTTRGVCYATTQNPTTSNSCVSSGTGAGAFTVNLTGLAPSTFYYIRAYATSVAGTSYGAQVSFQTGSAPINKQPTINSISNVSFLHSTNAPVSIPLTGITAGAGESGQNITVTARSSDPLLIPTLQVDYTSPQSTGTLRIQNNRTRVGSATISVRVKDDAGIANGGVDSVLVSFVANVILDTDLEDDITGPQEYRLDQNYPNPFNPSTKISFQLPAREMVTLAIYDTMGRQRMLLVNSELAAGSHDVTFDASNLSSGIYMYVLSTKNYTSSRKMTLIK